MQVEWYGQSAFRLSGAEATVFIDPFADVSGLAARGITFDYPAITGVSAEVAPDGSVRQQLGIYDQGILRVRVLGERRLTPFSRRPWLVPALSTILAAASIGIYFARRRSFP